MIGQLNVISKTLLEQYKKLVRPDLTLVFENLTDAEISSDTFSFYTSVASVFSSKIEGVEIELDSYIKHKNFGIEFLPDYTKKTDDLYSAYSFAKANTLNKTNVEQAHALLSKSFVTKHLLGKIRTQNMYVSSSDGKIEYVAASPFEVEDEMTKFYADLELLLIEPLTTEEVFYYAAMIHLVFVKIHPWNDGNGRSARLLEKWFLAQKLGAKAWFIQSEKNYYEHHQLYYSNIRKIGIEYPELDYSRSLTFLLMLPESLIIQ